MLGEIFDKWWSQSEPKSAFVRVDYIVISALYKGAIIQKIHKILWLLSAFENFLIKFCS